MPPFDIIDGYVKLLAHTSAATVFARWSAISMVAAALERRCWLSAIEGRPLYPNLFTLLIGLPATGKTESVVPADDLLTEAGCEEIYLDEGVSGRTASRPELDRALGRLRRGDTLVITRLSRLFRSLKHLISLTGQLRERDVHLKVTQQDIDTATPTGRPYASSPLPTRNPVRNPSSGPAGLPSLNGTNATR